MFGQAPPPPNKRPSPRQEAAGHREVARRWDRRDDAARRDKPKLSRKERVATIRLRELKRIFDHRYRRGGELPNDDAGVDDLELLVSCATAAGKDVEAIIRKFAPWCSQREIDRLVWSATCYPVRYSSDEIGERLNLTTEERQLLRITTIAAAGTDKAERERQRRERGNMKKRVDRASARKPDPRMAAVMAAVSNAEITVAAIVELVRKSPAFQDVSAASVKVAVHRVVNRLVKAGQFAARTEPGRCGGVVSIISRRQQ